jgi:4-hydroxy-tetrahydrodipicolinate synthase
METIGCGTAIVTPFKADGSIDEPAFWSLVNWQIESGIDFIVACGSTGEAATLDEDEWPGVAAVLSANPYYNKPTQEGQFQHFLALAREVDPLPVCVYNVPGRTAANLEPETVARLAAAAKNIEAIKEASGKLVQFTELAHIMPQGFKIFSGDDGLALAAIEVGAHGLISVASNEVPAEVARMIRAALDNNWDEARELERRFSPLFEANFWESNPAPVKTVLSLMGKCGDQLRLPLVPPTATTRARLERLVGELGLLNHVPIAEGLRSKTF